LLCLPSSYRPKVTKLYQKGMLKCPIDSMSLQLCVSYCW
jgi:hypothetical protein